LTGAGYSFDVADPTLELVSKSNLAKILAINRIEHNRVTHDACAFERTYLIHGDDGQLCHVGGIEPGDDRPHTDKLICAIVAQDESRHPIDRVVLLTVR